HWAQADVVLADSQAVADRLDGLDAHVVYCPVELDPPPVDAPWAGGGANGGPVVGFVGRIEPRKGVLDLIAAAPAIRRAAPGAEVIDDGVTGLLVEPGEPDALAAAVLEVLGRRDTMSAAARQAARRFGADAYADRVEPLIRP